MTYTNEQAIERRRGDSVRRVLVVDDDEFNLEILQECLSRSGDQVTSVNNGTEALQCLRSATEAYHIVLLDRMMPNMSGLEVFEQMQADERLCRIPVVMQTAAATVGDIESGLSAGILYYLSKPYNREGLFSIMSTAVADTRLHRELCDVVCAEPVQPPQAGEWSFSTLGAAKTLAVQLAAASAQPQKTVVGLYELLSNAVEHGLLGVGYDDKTRLIEAGSWEDEIVRRSARNENQALIRVSLQSNQIHYQIDDRGPGFDSSAYLHIAPERARDNHGRGIAFAGKCFQYLEYNTCGNSVTAVSQAVVSSP
ncbi:MAG: response regulator [Gammaproteobacteria bacterium]|nr:response regulator [Gammaproteobacteria bacterium]MDH5801126.1 response regulator [Gammaproteobacteria bacterium]